MTDDARKSSTPPPGLTFFRQWLKNPLGTAAISPSSKQLARQMLSQLPAQTKRVIELGGGTGVFTRAILEHGIAPQDLLVLELNEELHQHLLQMFQGVKVVCGDASRLHSIAQAHGFHEEHAADAIISGLGLLSMPKTTQRKIMSAAFSSLQSHGRFIQFTYGPAQPVNREIVEELALTVRRASFTWRNVPPATVYVYQRRVSRTLRPKSMR